MQTQKADPENTSVTTAPQSLRSAPWMSSTDRSISSTDASSSAETVPAGCFASVLLRKRCALSDDSDEDAARDRYSCDQEDGDVSSTLRPHEDSEVLRSYEDYLKRFHLFSHEAQDLSRDKRNAALTEHSGRIMEGLSDSFQHYPTAEVQMESQYFLGSSIEETSEIGEGSHKEWEKATLTDLEILCDTFSISGVSDSTNWRQKYRAGSEGETRLPLALQARRPSSLALDSGLPSSGIWDPD